MLRTEKGTERTVGRRAIDLNVPPHLGGWTSIDHLPPTYSVDGPTAIGVVWLVEGRGAMRVTISWSQCTPHLGKGARGRRKDRRQCEVDKRAMMRGVW